MADLSFIQSAVQAAAAFAVGFLGLIALHELGHLWAGRWVGLIVERFSIGFGPSFTVATDRRGTRWTLGILPFGGMVRFRVSGPGGLEAASPGARAFMAAAGPAANAVGALLVLWALFVSAGMPPPEAVIAAFRMAGAVARIIYRGVFDLVADPRPEVVGGPVQIAAAAGEAVDAGWFDALLFAATFSVNLAALNVLPVPGLDGWMVVAAGAERLTGRRLPKRARLAVLALGASCILGLVALGILGDLRFLASKW